MFEVIWLEEALAELAAIWLATAPPGQQEIRTVLGAIRQ